MSTKKKTVTTEHCEFDLVYTKSYFLVFILAVFYPYMGMRAQCFSEEKNYNDSTVIFTAWWGSRVRVRMKGGARVTMEGVFGS